MSEALRSDPQTVSLSVPAKIGWAILIGVTLLVCYFSHLGAIGFVGPDEPRYAWIARAMVETGDWITPRLYGRPWFEKPPLFYWGAALSFKLFGVSEAAARLPSAVCALLTTLAMGWLAWRMYGAETARWLLLLLPTTVGMIGFSHAAATDMPFSAMLTIAMVCAAVVLGLVPSERAESNQPAAATTQRAKRVDPQSADAEADATALSPQNTPWFALVLFGFFLGLAVLAKGPAAIVLCGGTVFFWVLVTNRWRDAFRLVHPGAVAAFSITALPWYILCARRNPDFLRIFIIEHNFKRYVTPEFQHVQPFWYYGPIFLLATFPWLSLFVPLVKNAYDSWKVHRLVRSRGLFFGCWALFVLFFFTASRSKLPGYILPAIPPVVLLLAEACKTLTSRSRSIQRWTGVLLCLALFGTAAAVGAVENWNLRRLAPGMDAWYSFTDRFPFLFLLAGTFCCAVLVFARRTRLSFQIGALVLTVALLGSFRSRLLALEDLSARQFLGPTPHAAPFPVNGVGYYALRRSYLYAFDFYFHRELPQWVHGDTRLKWVYTDSKNIRDASAAGLDCGAASYGLWYKPPILVCVNPGAQ